MALEGYTSFVIEGNKGKEIYDQIMNLKAQCEQKKEAEIEVATFGKKSYHIGLYTLTNCNMNTEDILALTLQVKNGGHASSWINHIEFVDSILRIQTSWRHGSALMYYFADCQLDNDLGYYYLDSSEQYISGITNDQAGKYFEVINDEAPEEYSVPEGETSLGNDYYMDWSKLRKLHIPAFVNEVEDFIFRSAPMLQEIEIAKNNPKYDSRQQCNAIIETATNRLLIGCSKTIIPDSVKTIGQHAFSYVDKLTEISLPESIESIEAGGFIGCESLQKISLSQSIKRIENETFEGCKALTELTLPKGLISIGERAFMRCHSLTTLEIPNTVTYIGSCAFDGCTSLHTLIVPSSVKYINACAFRDCIGLRSIVIEANDIDIADDAFKNCFLREKDLVHNFPDTPEHHWGINFYDNEIDGICIQGNEIVHVRKDVSTVTIPEHITGIANWAFSKCTAITSILLPAHINSIKYGAFQKCSQLRSVNLPDGLTKIANLAFSYCFLLEAITIPHSVEYIGDFAFFQCHALKSIRIPQSIKEIGTTAFGFCESLVEIHYEGGIEQWQQISKGCDWCLYTGAIVVHCTDGDVEL